MHCSILCLHSGPQRCAHLYERLDAPQAIFWCVGPLNGTFTGVGSKAATWQQSSGGWEQLHRVLQQRNQMAAGSGWPADLTCCMVVCHARPLCQWSAAGSGLGGHSSFSRRSSPFSAADQDRE